MEIIPQPTYSYSAPVAVPKVPTPVNAPSPRSYSGSSKKSALGIAFVIVGIVGIIITGVWLHWRRQKQKSKEMEELKNQLPYNQQLNQLRLFKKVPFQR